MRYFLLTDENDTINGPLESHFVPGLNVATKFFHDHVESDFYCSEIFYGFTLHTRDVLEQQYNKTYIWDISLPVNDFDLKIFSTKYGCYVANKIILHQKYLLSEPETYERLDIIMINMDYASANAYLKILDWWKNSVDEPAEVQYTEKSMDLASCYGQISSLNWWLESGLALKYSEQALYFASLYDKIDVLQWWLDSGLELRYDSKFLCLGSVIHSPVLEWWHHSGLKWPFGPEAIARVCYYRNIDILNWLINSGVEVSGDHIIDNIIDGYIYQMVHNIHQNNSEDIASCLNFLDKILNLGLVTSCYKAVDLASDYDLLDILNWLHLSGLKIQYSDRAIDNASINGHIHILDWWFNSGLELKYSVNAIDYASRRKHIHILDWWLNSGLELKYSMNAIDNLIEDHINVLDWWLNSGLELRYASYAINSASLSGNLDVLNWWLGSNLELKYDECAINWASAQGCLDVLNWWVNSGLELKYDENAINWASVNGHVEVLNWWLDSGLELKYYTNIYGYGFYER